MVILLGDAALVLKDFVDGCISLTVTSPPYDDLRDYGGHSFDFKLIAKELYRVTTVGGVIVWVIGDATTEGSETGTSFKQALYFMEVGFKLHDTMIFMKKGFANPSNNRYHQVFEYMFILSKGRLNTFNPITDKPNTSRSRIWETHSRKKSGELIKSNKIWYQSNKFGMRYNVWEYGIGGEHGDMTAYTHPATFPLELAKDHIKSWSNEGDLVLDPFAGSGTTLKAAQQLNRKWIGIEINPDYVQLAKKRLSPYVQQQRLDQFQTV